MKPKNINLLVVRLEILREFFHFLKDNKKWWLAPVSLILLLLAALIFFSGGSILAPFIYTVF